jgi:hypothetical protein
MSENIQKYVAECDLCQRNNNENVSTLGLLDPLHIPIQKWEEISMDFIEGLPISDEKDKILVAIDRLTKYARFIGVRETKSTKQMTKIFCKNISNYMGSLRFSSAIEMPNLKGIFGENFANRSEPLSI